MNKPKQLTFPWNKNTKVTFNNFYIDPKNINLVMDLKDVTINDDFFIYGVSNSGKTYLQQSLCNFFQQLDKSSIYIPLNEAIKYGVNILDSIENIDLICIDNLELIEKNLEWQIAIFNLINNTVLSNSKLFFTVSKDNGSLNFSMPDLDSRIKKMQSYELFEVQENNISAALQHIAKSRLINLGEAETRYLLKYSTRSISYLTKILDKLDNTSMELKRKITIPLIKEFI